ncbi:hypothetical protein, partial [Streptomyces cadmiisoli]|uniref:hypothetical protein n=1 Tax=Streptomyces cadmiisoli TaxID=2184053 RepID=UPI0036670CF2
MKKLPIPRMSSVAEVHVSWTHAGSLLTSKPPGWSWPAAEANQGKLICTLRALHPVVRRVFGSGG